MAARMPKDEPARGDMEKEADAISSEFGDRWLQQLKKYGEKRYHRGLVHLFVSPEILLSRPLSVLAGSETWEWIEYVRLRRMTGKTLIRLGDSKLLPSVAHVRLGDFEGLSSDHVTALFFSAGLGGVRSLEFGSVGELPAESITRAMASAPALRGLIRLEIGSARPNAPAVANLAASMHLANLQVLDLGSSTPEVQDIGKEGIRALADSPFLGRLRTLLLRRTSIDDGAMAILAASPHLAHITELDLSDNWIEAEGVEALAASPHAQRLRSLNLSNNPIGPRGVEALATSPYLRELERLDLIGCGIGIQGARVLAETEKLPALKSLELDPEDIPGHVLTALRQRYPGAGLRVEKG
jgi:hypothetical protein